MKFAALILSVLFIISCNKNPELQVLRTNIGNNIEIEDLKEIYFEFNYDIIKYENHTSDSKSYLTIDPPLSGSFEWRSSKEIVFVPSYGNLKPNTEYKVILQDGLLAEHPELVLPQNREYTFSTQKFNISKVVHYWDQNTNSKHNLLNLNLVFNHDFELKNNQNQFQFLVNDEPVVVESINKNSFGELSCILDIRTVLKSKNNDLKIKINPGLTIGTYAKSITTKEIEWVGQISSPDEFIISWIEANSELDNSNVIIYLNQALSTESDFKSMITIEPNIDFDIEMINNRLILTGEFLLATTYKLDLLSSIKSTLGKNLNPETQYLRFSELEPMIQFEDEDAIYLPSKGSRNIAIRLNDVNDLYLHIYKIYENNLLEALNSGISFYDYYDEDYESEYYYHDNSIKNIGDLILTKRIDISDLAIKGNTRLLNIDFKDFIKDKGLYAIYLIDSTNTDLVEEKILSISDLGIITKKSKNDLFVSINSLNTSLPVSGAKVVLISQNNQIIDESTTSADGSVYFRNLQDRKKAKNPALIRVEKNGEINYLNLNSKTVFDNSTFDFVGGSEITGYRAFIYGDRELYRPGDSLHIAGIVRDENRKVINGLPITLQLVLPNSIVFKEFVVVCDDNGGFGLSYKIPNEIVTGTYRIKAITSSNKIIGEKKISIEQFIPERIKVSIKTNKESYKSNDIIEISALSENLFGTPASNRNYEASINFKELKFKNRDLRNYTFDVINNNIESLFSDFSGSSNSKGEIYFNYPLQNLTNIGNVEARISLTVFDETSRPVTTSKTVQIQTQPYYFGIGKINDWLNINSRCQIPIVAVKSDGSSAGSVDANVKIVRKFWKTIARKSEWGDYINYENEEFEEIIVNKITKLNGKSGSIEFTPKISGVYEVRVGFPDSESYVTYSLFAYGVGYTNSGAFKVSKEGFVNIYSDEEKYQIGDKAKLVFQTPFNGRLIITIERNGILENYTLNTVSKTAELILDIKENHLPNIYVSAVLIKPVLDASIPINVAYGYHSLKIDKASTILPISISTVSNSRSETKQSVIVRTIAKKNVNVTVAVVDEGIHQIKRTKTPDPHGFFYEKIALGVKTFDVYKLVFPELSPKAMTFGGGESSDNFSMESFLFNRFADERVKPVAIWSGILKTNSAGEVKFDFDIPKFSGSLKIAAVAYNDDAFGKCDTNMIIRDPLILSAGMPRFLAVGDETFSSVVLTNTTNKSMEVKLSISSSGPAKISNLTEKQVVVGANSERRVKFDVKALNYEGLAVIKITANAGNEKQIETVKLPVRFTSVFAKKYESGSLQGNQTREIVFSSTFEPNSAISHVILSNSPVIEYFNGIDFLLNYPYGCMEQTVSKAFPLIYFPEITKISKISTDQNLSTEASKIISNVIDRTKMLQLPEGGWGMWESDYEGHWWITCYTTHFLIASRNAGYKVDSKSIDRALKYIRAKTINVKAIQYIGRSGKVEQNLNLLPNEAFYGIFVLALAGKSDYSIMNYYKNQLVYISDDSKVLLACAYKLTGDESSFNNIITNINTKPINYNYYPNSSLGSPVRQQALMLYAIASADPHNKKIPELTKNLSGMMRNNYNLTTQEASFGFMALGKVLSNNKTSENVAGYANDGKNEFARLNPNNNNVSGSSRSNKVLLTNNSSGKMYYFVNTIGLPKDGKVKNSDNYIKVRRQFYNKSGSELSVMNFNSGDIIIVKISVSSISGYFSANDMVVTDLLPAGFEVENPRITDLNSYKWMNNPTVTKFDDFRDDRVNIYFDFNTESVFYYSIRAVAPGIYNMGPITATSMYNSDIYSVNGGSKITINQR